jgi:hypothetical protein
MRLRRNNSTRMRTMTRGKRTRTNTKINASDASDEQYYEAQENYTAEVNEEDDNAGDEQEPPDSDGFDEDDQDRYI